MKSLIIILRNEDELRSSIKEKTEKTKEKPCIHCNGGYLSHSAGVRQPPINAIIGTITAVIVTIIVIVLMQFFLAGKKIDQTNIGSRFMGMIHRCYGFTIFTGRHKNFFLAIVS